MTPTKKVTKAQPAANFSIGEVNMTREDMKTISAAVRFGGLQLTTTDEISKKLGITKNAWHLRWRRAKGKLDRIQLDTVGSSQGVKTERSDDINTMLVEMAEETNEETNEDPQVKEDDEEKEVTA